MQLQIGIYDFFSITIPGGLFLGVLVYAFIPNSDVIHFVKTVNFTMVIILAILSYIVGHIISYISKVLWGWFGRHKKLREEAFTKVLAEHPEIEALITE